jgi:hypothetical protein
VQHAEIIATAGDEPRPYRSSDREKAGNNHQAQAAFEVPESTLASPVNIVVKERGLFGTSKVSVPVSIAPPP